MYKMGMKIVFMSTIMMMNKPLFLRQVPVIHFYDEHTDAWKNLITMQRL